MSMNRRTFLQTSAAIAGSALLPSDAKAADQPANVVDIREDALVVPKRPIKSDDYSLFKFETETLPDAPKVELRMLASQAYQIATIGDRDGGKLKAIVLPNQDGSVKVLQLRPGQEVEMQFYMTKDALDPIAKTGGALGKHLKEGEVPNWMKPITDAIEKDDATKGARNNLVKPFYAELVAQFDECQKHKKFEGDLATAGMYLDGHIQSMMTQKERQ